MRKFEVPTREQVAPATQAIFDGVKQKIGMVPNIYATIGYSANALDSYLAFQGAQAKGSFNAKEEETLNLRAGKSENERLNALVALVREVTLKHGRPSSLAVENFFAQGFDNAALMDLVLLVADNTVTNYVNNVTEIAIDFPAAKPLEEVAEV